MSKTKSYILIFVIIILSFLSVVLLLKYNKLNSAADNTSQGYYILKEYNNKVALFSSSKNTPLEIYNIKPADLPFKDEELLKQGIKCSSKKEALLKIEDYE